MKLGKEILMLKISNGVNTYLVEGIGLSGVARGFGIRRRIKDSEELILLVNEKLQGTGFEAMHANKVDLIAASDSSNSTPNVSII